jgi:hypothetical protein
MQRTEGFIRLRCADCETDVLLARWVFDLITLDTPKCYDVLEKRGGVGEL